MTEPASTNFLGIPIHGEILQRNKRKNQRPRSEFEQIVKALLDDPDVDSFGWTQYTPYFNDGDECVFGADQIWLRTIREPKVSLEQRRAAAKERVHNLIAALSSGALESDEEVLRVSRELVEAERQAAQLVDDSKDEEEAEDDSDTFDLGSGVHPSLGGFDWHQRRQIASKFPATSSRAQELYRAVNGGEFDNVLLQLFGDHCEVTVTKTKIEVKFYEHD